MRLNSPWKCWYQVVSRSGERQRKAPIRSVLSLGACAALCACAIEMCRNDAVVSDITGDGATRMLYHGSTILIAELTCGLVAVILQYRLSRSAANASGAADCPAPSASRQIALRLGGRMPGEKFPPTGGHSSW